ncbi:hypothetical protein KIW84_022627 [Lathyrus oleraceus]|uniref:Uncharacterized protein n=1 Tax=Pisum sativum TaxID=3888 RepID=A0A9D4YAY7_PEA|nr:hypothetical protein KIW84_022627 [Pisum sativum]
MSTTMIDAEFVLSTKEDVARNIDEDVDEVNVISQVFRILEPVIIKYDGSKQKASPTLIIKPAGPVPTNTTDYAERPVGNAVNAPNPAPVAKPTSTLKTSVSVGPSGNAKEDCDEMLRLIKRSEYNVVDQLLQTPSKIFVLSLLMNSEPHREALQKVLDVAYVDHDVMIEQFDSIVANITVWPPMRQSGVVVKAFDGSCKTVIGEVDLPVKIGPSDFQITFQVMDIHPSYSCLLGRPWIHEAGAVTSTLHQKLKFVKNKKLVVVGGEKALLVSHLSSFSYIDAEDEVGTSFQALSIVEPVKKGTSSFASYKDAKLAIEHSATAGLRQMIKLEDNQSRTGIGYSSSVFNKQGLFKSGGFIHTGRDEEAAAILEEDAEDSDNFIIPGGICNN